ncbi:DUF2232 domain-containing protein [Desulfobulbus propionicus]|jgi:uncharacterized protein YybS (DUF2232 family)
MELFGLRWGKAGFSPGQFLLLSTLFFLPLANPALFGWLNGLLALPVFYILSCHGYTAGVALLRASLLLTGLAAVALHRLEVYLFILTMVPLGFSMHRSAQNQESAATAGGKGLVVLAVTWLTFWTGYGLLTGNNPYTSLLKALDLGFQQTLEISSAKDAGLSPEMAYNLQIITESLRKSVPRLLPGILATATIFTVWMNMVIGNYLLARRQSAPWGKYATWKLPDQLVWLPIVAIIAILLGKGSLQHWGGCLLFATGTLYFFQGLAVLMSLLERWNVPMFARFILYGIILVQSYSLFFLAVLGMCDVWFNVRQQSKER